MILSTLVSISIAL